MAFAVLILPTNTLKAYFVPTEPVSVATKMQKVVPMANINRLSVLWGKP
jgi:hypothetical protein